MKENDDTRRRDADVELLGQKLSYPRRWQGVLAVMILGGTLVTVAYILLVQSRPEALKTLGLFTGKLQIYTDSVEKKNVFSHSTV